MTLRNSNPWRRLAAVLLCALVAPGFALAQEEEEAETGPQPAELIITPSEVELEVGDSLTLQSEVRDAEGNPMDRTVVFYSRRRRAVGVNPAGIVEAYRPGEHTLIAMVPKDPEDTNRRAEPAVMLEIPVTIPNPPVATVEVANMPGHLYTGTEIGLRPVVTDISGAVRNDVEVGWSDRRFVGGEPWTPSGCSPWWAPARRPSRSPPRRRRATPRSRCSPTRLPRSP